MVTKQEAINPSVREFYHVSDKQADGKTPVRCRRNGQTKVWKTRPDEFRIPVKQGFYGQGYITQANAHEWVPADKWDAYTSSRTEVRDNRLTEAQKQVVLSQRQTRAYWAAREARLRRDLDIQGIDLDTASYEDLPLWATEEDNLIRAARLNLIREVSVLAVKNDTDLFLAIVRYAKAVAN